jgi:hypothetical protein
LKINSLSRGTTTLASLGFDVHVGTVVWNQCKDILTDDDTETRLIYSGDIAEYNSKDITTNPNANILHSLTVKSYSDQYKKNYIQKSGTRDTVLLVNRGYGKGKYAFKYYLLDSPDFSYLVENHLTVICASSTSADKPVSFQRIIDSFNDPRTAEFVDLYFENNAINTTELKYILPIYGN